MKGLRIRDVEKKTGAKKTKIHDLINKGLFPQPMKIGRMSIWVESEIDEALEAFARRRGIANAR